MKGKKITALLLGTCMMATVLAGCGGKAGNTDGNATTGTSTTGNGETKEAEAGFATKSMQMMKLLLSLCLRQCRMRKLMTETMCRKL